MPRAGKFPLHVNLAFFLYSHSRKLALRPQARKNAPDFAKDPDYWRYPIAPRISNVKQFLGRRHAGVVNFDEA